ncbi:unnamed protein product [Clavelina lepadiformis]|uniref:Uncharacterized protein n=1 Tax=Clavelina lepadiformis TaxID=159417 RepID=A0ABP0FEI2_CLALP
MHIMLIACFVLYRMDILATRWENGYVRRLKTDINNSYFEDNEQRAKTVIGFVELGALLFNVFFSESINYSINKMQRRDLKSAENVIWF